MPEISSTFQAVWTAYKRAVPDDASAPVSIWKLTVKVGGENLGLDDAIGLSWNDTTQIPEELRKQIVAELNIVRPEQRWNDRIFRYSQAARALEPVILRMMTIEPLRTSHR